MEVTTISHELKKGAEIYITIFPVAAGSYNWQEQHSGVIESITVASILLRITDAYILNFRFQDIKEISFVGL